MGALGRFLRISLAGALAGTFGCGIDIPDPIPAARGPDATPTRGGTLELATFADMRGALDPATVSDGIANQVVHAMFSGLVDFDGSGHVVPALAERWTVDEDGRAYTFTLRPGARFHDGEEVTAEDVKRSVERTLHPTTPAPYASYLESLVGYEDYVSGKAEHLAGVEVVGRYVVRFRLDRPDAIFLPVLGLHAFRPVCRSAGDRYSDTWAPCGAGPFKLPPDGWDRGRSVRIVRHESYWDPDLPRLDAVRWTFKVPQTTQRFKLTRGELDVMRDFLEPELVAFQNDPRWRPYGELEPERSVNGESMNTEVPPFDNVEVRRAVAAAIDREQFQKLRRTTVTILTRPIPASIPGADETVEGQRFDLDAALEHMRRAGYPYDPATGKGGWPHPIPYLTYKQGFTELTGQVLAQQLARIGLRLEMRMVTYGAFMAMRGRRGQSAIGPASWQLDFPGALSFLEPLWTSRAINDEDSNNTSFYRNARVDELVDRARRELDEERRRRLTSEAQRIIVDEAPWAFTYSYRFYVQQQPYVKENASHPVWSAEVSRTWLDRAPERAASRTFFGGRSAASALAALFTGAPRGRKAP